MHRPICIAKKMCIRDRIKTSVEASKRSRFQTIASLYPMNEANFDPFMHLLSKHCLLYTSFGYCQQCHYQGFVDFPFASLPSLADICIPCLLYTSDVGFGMTVQDKNAPDLVPLYELSNKMGMEFATASLPNSFYFVEMCIRDSAYTANIP